MAYEYLDKYSVEELQGYFSDFFHINSASFGINFILNKVIKHAGKINRMAMGKMAAVREAHRKDSIAHVEDGKINRQVGRSAAMGLNVDVFSTKEFFTARNRQLFHFIRMDTAGMKAFARVPLDGLGVKDRPQGFHDGLG